MVPAKEEGEAGEVLAQLWEVVAVDAEWNALSSAGATPEPIFGQIAQTISSGEFHGVGRVEVHVGHGCSLLLTRTALGGSGAGAVSGW